MPTFHIENSLYRFFDRTQFNRVSAIMTHQGHYINENCGDYLKREDSDIDLVSYIPKFKVDKIDRNLDIWDSNQKTRIPIKIGRMVSKFVNRAVAKEINLKDSEIEEFVNLFKSYFCADESKLKIVEGNDILPFYDMDFYSTVNGNTCGTLWNSCMRYKEKNKFMKLYADNPESVKMLVYLDDNNKVRARALLWMDAKDKYGNSFKVMDRIYSLFDHDVPFFKEWAKKNGYLSKMEQSAHSETYFTLPDGKSNNQRLYIQLKNYKQKYYPYFDTFKFYDPETGRFHNSDNSDYAHVLIQNWGGLEPEPRADRQEPPMDDDFSFDDQVDHGDDWGGYYGNERRTPRRRPARVVPVNQSNTEQDPSIGDTPNPTPNVAAINPFNRYWYDTPQTHGSGITSSFIDEVFGQYLEHTIPTSIRRQSRLSSQLMGRLIRLRESESSVEQTPDQSEPAHIPGIINTNPEETSNPCQEHPEVTEAVRRRRNPYDEFNDDDLERILRIYR